MPWLDFRVALLTIIAWAQRLERALWGVPIAAQQVKNPTSIQEDEGLIPGLTQGVEHPALKS